ncbi:PAS domain-containing protein [Jannaschia formosa]|uniref:PAS domain-containing protein n=1 Tax=Jannaschia formosa TaxID=2259592 RepID=UPI000E1C1D0F|nr:PAS domain-containing protein [Jannaschia formosa]
MTGPSMILFLLQGAAAGALALAAALWVTRERAARPRPLVLGTLSEPRSFVFRDGYLVAHSGNVGFLLPDPIDHLRAWDGLIDALGRLVDGAFRAFEALEDEGRSFRLEGRLGRDRLLIVGMRQGAELRVTVASAEAEEAAMRVDLDNLRALEAEAALLTGTADTCPTASWVLDTEDSILWANAAYQDVVGRSIGPDASRGWPIAALFPAEAGALPGRTRRQILDGEGAPLWFEIAAGAPDAAGRRHMHAVSLDGVVAAEDSLRTFMQTLTKTFAHLPTGLAIFDRERRLAMFNPALMDMTGLDGMWLSRRPKLEDFFDALRDHRKLPEPRDYKVWRDGLSDLARVGARGTYRETWSLPSGQTYCVTGRPQADGAVALMLEDISEGVSADRAHQGEREALVGALAACDDALIVFGADGRRIADNPAARRMLPGAAPPDTLEEAIRTWRPAFHPSAAWADLRLAARGEGSAADLADRTLVLHRDGGPDLAMRIVPRRGGGLTLGFGPASVQQAGRTPLAMPAE